MHQSTDFHAFPRATLSLGALVLAAATPLAHAHHAMDGATPGTFMEGLLSGIAHPVIGIDHFAFLVVVALVSAGIAGRLRYLLPLAFVLATVGGTLYHLGAADLPMAETVIALSALLGGLFVVFKGSMSALLAGALFASIGIFHGYAYGESIIGAETTPLLSYLIGFAAIQYAIVFAGVKLLSVLARRSAGMQQLAVRLGAGFATLTGALFLGLGLA